MTEETFLAAIDFTRWVEADYRSVSGDKSEILLSGGECTEHPDIVKMVARVYASGMRPFIITNGSWMADVELRKSLLRPEWNDLRFQVTYDARFYPKPLTVVVDDPRIRYVTELTGLIPLGRIKNKKGPHPIPNKVYPASFNLRSLTRAVQSFSKAVSMIRLRAANGLSGHCIPSINNDGTLVAGETNLCFPIGTVLSDNEQITRSILEMGSCNRCSLETNLSEQHKKAIGL